MKLGHYTTIKNGQAMRIKYLYIFNRKIVYSGVPIRIKELVDFDMKWKQKPWYYCERTYRRKRLFKMLLPWFGLVAWVICAQYIFK